MNTPIILLTDFGTSDWFVGSMKAVLASLAPQSPVIDLCHEIDRGNILHANWMLSKTFQDFPSGSVLCCVVDPGVGTERKAIVARAEFTEKHYFFVGPDNGLFSGAKKLANKWETFSIANDEWKRKNCSETFHGRDIFAPAAAKCATGCDLSTAGNQLNQIQNCEIPSAVFSNGDYLTTIMHIDSFGNAITNLTQTFVSLSFTEPRLVFRDCKEKNIYLYDTFAAVEPNVPLLYWGSLGVLEIGINLGSAAKHFGFKIGDQVRISIDESEQT